MIRFKIKGKDGHFLCPSSAKEILFRDFISYLNIKKPQALLDIELKYSNYEKAVASEDFDAIVRLKAEIDEVVNYYNPTYLGIIKDYFVQVIIRFIEIDAEDVELLEVSNIEFLYLTILKAISTIYELDEIQERFVINNIEYAVPETFMQNATLIEYIEAAQLQASKAKLQNGKFEAMFDVLCVLMRKVLKDGTIERYTEQVFYRNQNDFSKIDLDTVTRVSFFLQSQMSSYAQSFQIYTLSQTLSKLKLGLKN